MNRWIRSASARSRIRCGRHSGGGPLEADESADERVVTGVGSIAVPLPEQAIKTVLGRGKGGRDVQAEAPQPRRSDRDEQRLHRLDPLLQIPDAAAHEIAP